MNIISHARRLTLRLESPIEICSHCQADVQAVVGCTIERRQIVDRPDITEPQAERLCCPSGHARTCTSLPGELRTAVMDGADPETQMVSPVTPHFLPYNQTSGLLMDLV
jgi:hypothetical protein